MMKSTQTRPTLRQSAALTLMTWLVGIMSALLGLAILISGRTFSRNRGVVEDPFVVWPSGLTMFAIGAFFVVRSILNMGGDEGEATTKTDQERE